MTFTAQDAYDRLLDGSFYEDYDESSELLGALKKHLDDVNNSIAFSQTVVALQKSLENYAAMVEKLRADVARLEWSIAVV